MSLPEIFQFYFSALYKKTGASNLLLHGLVIAKSNIRKSADQFQQKTLQSLNYEDDLWKANRPPHTHHHNPTRNQENAVLSL